MRPRSRCLQGDTRSLRQTCDNVLTVFCAAMQSLQVLGCTGVGSKALAFGWPRPRLLRFFVRLLTFASSCPPAEELYDSMRSGVLLCQVRQALHTALRIKSHALADREQAGKERIRRGNRAQAEGQGAVHTQLQKVLIGSGLVFCGAVVRVGALSITRVPNVDLSSCQTFQGRSQTVVSRVAQGP